MTAAITHLIKEHEFRCTAPHPVHIGRPCNAKVTAVVPDTVTAERTAEVKVGCTVYACRRCGTSYRFCSARRSE